MIPINIFLSWSKPMSKALAKELDFFLKNLFGNKLKIFISSGMEKGALVDAGIHSGLIDSKLCLVSITNESIKSPWLMYEAGVVFGSGGTVIPILFEDIPSWSSWIDKPLIRYVPVNYNKGKKDFYALVQGIEKRIGIKSKNFELNWTDFSKKVDQILVSHQLFPFECKYIVEKLREYNDNYFTPNSPDIQSDRVVFHKGFHSDPLFKILTDNIKDDGGKYFWYYARKASKLLRRQYLKFFEFLAESERAEGMGIDFRCLIVRPNSTGAIKADRGQAEKFNLGLQESIEYALSLKNIGLTPSKYFRLYDNIRDFLIIRSDNSILTSGPVYDTKGVLNYFTESSFSVLSALKGNKMNGAVNKGYLLVNEFEKIWESSLPLTEDVFNSIYTRKIFYKE